MSCSHIHRSPKCVSSGEKQDVKFDNISHRIQASKFTTLACTTGVAVTGRTLAQGSGTRKRELCRREPKDKNQNCRFGEVEGYPLPPGNPSVPPTFPDGFPGGRRPFLSAPFGAALFYGYPKGICVAVITMLLLTR